jgi:hypothetical protein
LALPPEETPADFASREVLLRDFSVIPRRPSLDEKKNRRNEVGSTANSSADIDLICRDATD